MTLFNAGLGQDGGGGGHGPKGEGWNVTMDGLIILCP